MLASLLAAALVSLRCTRWWKISERLDAVAPRIAGDWTLRAAETIRSGWSHRRSSSWDAKCANAEEIFSALKENLDQTP